MKRTSSVLSVLFLLAAGGCVQQLEGGVIDSDDTDDRLFDFKFNIHVDEERDMDKKVDKGTVNVTLAGDDEEFWEDTGAKEDEERKYTVSGPAFRLVMPESGKVSIGVTEKGGSGWGFDDVYFFLVEEVTPDSGVYRPIRIQFPTESITTSDKYPAHVGGTHTAFAFEKFEFDKDNDTLTVNTYVNMVTRKSGGKTTTYRYPTKLEEESLTVENTGLLDHKELLVFPAPENTWGDLDGDYVYTINATCGRYKKKAYATNGTDQVSLVDADAPCSEEAQATAEEQIEEGVEEGPIAPEPDAILDCGEGGNANGLGTECACDSGFAGDHCEFSDEETCNDNGKAQDNGECECLESSGRTGPNCKEYDCAKLTCDDGNSCTAQVCTARGGCPTPVAIDSPECTQEDEQELEEEAEEHEENSGGSTTGSGSSSSGSSSGSSTGPRPDSDDDPRDVDQVDDVPRAGGCSAGGSSGGTTPLLMLLAMAFMARSRRRRTGPRGLRK